MCGGIFDFSDLRVTKITRSATVAREGCGSSANGIEANRSLRASKIFNPAKETAFARSSRIPNAYGASVLECSVDAMQVQRTLIGAQRCELRFSRAPNLLRSYDDVGPR
jgi:hypothetical protein